MLFSSFISHSPFYYCCKCSPSVLKFFVQALPCRVL
nr:MAG TPA: hypothetical protein [Caudoviricetes sp.]